MTGTIFTNFVGTQNRRQYAMTQDEVASIAAGAGIVTFSSLTQALAPYLLISSLGGSLANYALLAGTQTLTGVNTFGARVLFSSAATFNAVATLGAGFVIPEGSTGFFSGPEPWCDASAPVFGMSSALSDNATALQSAINYMNTNFGGGNVRIPHGNFLFTNPVVVKGACKLVGVGRVLTILNGTAIDGNVLNFGSLCTDGCGLQDLAVYGYQSTLASHTTVIVAQNIPVTFRDCNIWFGANAINIAGEDGLIEDCSIQGYSYGVFSTGANWYLRTAIDDAICVNAAFHQDTSFVGSPSSENHFTDCDFSTAAAASVEINDASLAAITVLSGCIFSKAIKIINARATMISTGEIGGNITVSAGGGVVILTGNYTYNNHLTVTGGTSVIAVGNYLIN